MIRSYFISITLFLFLLSLLSACSSGNSGGDTPPQLEPITVNSIDDTLSPAAGTVTLRSALVAAESGQRIIFAQSLDGDTIELSIVGEKHTILKGEVMGMRNEPSGPISYLVGYFNRDYGKSALYAQKNVVIDASDLPSGITITWRGTEDARVLAVYGDLAIENVTITGGRSVTEDISATNTDQPWTLARGGAIAVWGRARIYNCAFYDNYCEGDFDSSRDRGTFGGAIYADIVEMEDSIVSGNTLYGAGVSGGGVFSVGGRDTYETTSIITRSAITGNHITGLMGYGGGVYSDGGGIGKAGTLRLVNSTIARNLVDYSSPVPFGYWRGGGVYMSNGSMVIKGCTVVENEVYGVPRTIELGKKNLAGGIAATIGNAHATEDIIIGHSIIAGNTVHELGGTTYEHDVFTGSAFYFMSMGYNRIGVLDLSQLLVPVGEVDWRSLSRRFYPGANDIDGVNISDVLDLTNGITYSNDILSTGVDEGDPAVLYYRPQGSALDRIPTGTYSVIGTYWEYSVNDIANDNFLEIMLDRLEGYYNIPGFAADFTTDFELFLSGIDTDDETAGNQPYEDPDGNPILTLADTHWFGPLQTWPKELYNYPYIEFWHQLDNALVAENLPEIGQAVISDEVWNNLFSPGPLSENTNIRMIRIPATLFTVASEIRDQLYNNRPANSLGDIGAIEIP
ncbi:MAG: hypothetical protein GX654_11355 [Desulfatiglans sp.]|nr:hypothetical protein [Desulfatiglans sp.]